jgi:hypothetical protein
MLLQAQAVSMSGGIASWQPTGTLNRLMTPSMAIRADIGLFPAAPWGLEAGAHLTSGMNAADAAETTFSGISLALRGRMQRGSFGFSLLPTIAADRLLLLGVPGEQSVRGLSSGLRARVDYQVWRFVRVAAEAGGAYFNPSAQGQRVLDAASARSNCRGTCVPPMSRVFNYSATASLQILLF